MKEKGKRRGSLPYRVLLVIIIGGVLALVLAAFSTQSPLTARIVLLLFAGLLLVVAVTLEIVFRDVTKLRERVRLMERERER